MVAPKNRKTATVSVVTSPPERPREVVPDTRCAWCDKPASSRCSSCQTIRFCSEECQRACWPIHKTLCKVDPKSFRFPPLPAADIEKLKKIKDESYGGPFTTYVVEGSLLQRIPKFLPPSIPSFSWEEIANILASPTSTEPVNITNDIREQIHAHARAHLYNYKQADSMPHGPDRTWIRVAHHVVTVVWAWDQGKYGDSACLKPGEIFRVYNGYLRQCVLFQWARDIALEAVRAKVPREELQAAGARAADLIERAKNTWEVESATVQQPDSWLTFKLSEIQWPMTNLGNS